MPIAGKPLVGWALEALQECGSVRGIVVVARPEFLETVRHYLQADCVTKVVAVVAGGEMRRESVNRGLQAVGRDCEWVLVHDAARPLLRPEWCERAIRAAAETGAAIVATPANDTLKLCTTDGFVSETLDRSRIWHAQTPQVFRRDLLERAHREAPPGDASDDAVLVECLGVRVRVVAVDGCNMKVTTREDFALAEALLTARSRAVRG